MYKSRLFCPDCGCHLVIRVKKADGMPFRGCSSYPKCKYTEPVEPQRENSGAERAVLAETLELVRSTARRVQCSAEAAPASLDPKAVAACAAALLRIVDYIEIWRPPEAERGATWDAIDEMTLAVLKYLKPEST